MMMRGLALRSSSHSGTNSTPSRATASFLFTQERPFRTWLSRKSTSDTTAKPPPSAAREHLFQRALRFIFRLPPPLSSPVFDAEENGGTSNMRATNSDGSLSSKSLKSPTRRHPFHQGTHQLELAKETKSMLLLLSGFAATGVSDLWFQLPAIVTAAIFALSVTLSRRITAGHACKIEKDLTGKVCLVTGGAAGIGLEVATRLACLGGTVVIIGSSDPSTVSSVSELRSHVEKIAPRPTQDVDKFVPKTNVPIFYEQVDLASLPAVQRFATHFQVKYGRLDILVNNAGILRCADKDLRYVAVSCKGAVSTSNATSSPTNTSPPPSSTGQQQLLIEEQILVNYIGPYLLTEALLPAIRASKGRIVYVTSSSHIGAIRQEKDSPSVFWKKFGPYFEPLASFSVQQSGKRFALVDIVQSTKEAVVPPSCHAFPLYSLSKLGNIFHALSLAERAESEIGKTNELPFRVCLVSPGPVLTNIYGSTGIGWWVQRARSVLIIIMRRPIEGAQPVLFTALSDEVINGGYYVDQELRFGGLSREAWMPSLRKEVLAFARQVTGY